MRWFFFLSILMACATTKIAPSEKLAFDYTQAFLRRDSTEMQTLGTSGVKHPIPNAYYATQKAVRTCPPQSTKGGPEAATILVLVGSTSSQQLEAMQVTVAHYGQQWLVIKAQPVQSQNGAPLLYSRTCQPIYGTPGGGTAY
jgi:hypothetical protein